MKRLVLLLCVLTLLPLSPALADETASGEDAIMPRSLAGKRVVFLGDSITQAGGYVTFVDYYLQKLYPQKDFNILGLGLASETLSGLSEEGHAGGAFPRPCLFERLARLLERTKPDIVFACYGINDGIYLPHDVKRQAAFEQGVRKLVDQCQDAGVKQVYLVTPPIYDLVTQPGEFNYDEVMTKYAAWENALKRPGVQVIDLHTAMREARDARQTPFSRDHVHPGSEGHLLMAKTILAALDVRLPEESLVEIENEPLFKEVAKLRRYRSGQWMKHIGYTREKTVVPQPLGETGKEAAKMQAKIDSLRRHEK